MRVRFQGARFLTLAILVLWIASCTSVPKRNPLPTGLAESATVLGIEGARIWGDVTPLTRIRALAAVHHHGWGAVMRAATHVESDLPLQVALVPLDAVTGPSRVLGYRVDYANRGSNALDGVISPPSKRYYNSYVAAVSSRHHPRRSITAHWRSSNGISLSI